MPDPSTPSPDQSKFDPSRQVEQILRGAFGGDKSKDDQRDRAWQAYHTTRNSEDFNQAFSTLGFPQETVDQLRALKFGPPKPAVSQFGPKDVLAAGVTELPTIGGAVGAGIGAFAGHPIIGAGLGGMAGEATRQAVISGVGPENLSGNIIKVPPQPEGYDARERTRDILGAGGEQAASEFGGARIAGLGRGLLTGPLHRAASTPENLPVKETSERFGLRLTPGEIAQETKVGRFTGAMQHIGEYGIFSRGIVQSSRKKGMRNGLQAIDNLLDRLHPSTSPLTSGASVRAAVDLSNGIFKKTAITMYGDVDTLAKGVMVNMKPVRAEAQKMLDEILENKKYFPETGGIGDKAEKILRDAVRNDWVPFKQAQIWRTNLLDIGPQLDQLLTTRAKGTAQHLSGTLTEAMENSAAALNPAAKDAWVDARDFWKNGAELFKNSTIAGLMDRNNGAELIAKSIKPGMVSDAKMIRSAILDYPLKKGDPLDRKMAVLAWRQFQQQFVRTNLLRDPEHVGGQKAVEEMLQLKQRIEEMGPGVLNEIFQDQEGKAALKNLTDIGNALARIEKMPIEGRRSAYDILTLIEASLVGLTGANISAASTALKGVAGFEGTMLLITGAMHNQKAAGYLVDGIGGIMKSFENQAIRHSGGAVTRFTGRYITSPKAIKISGPVVSNFIRAWDLIQRDNYLMDKQDQKLDIDVKPPGWSPYQQNGNDSGNAPPPGWSPYQ